MKKIDISKFYPCRDGLSYYSTQPSSIESWNNCEMGDWMLYTAKKLGADERKLSLAKGLCAETVIHLMGDERSRKAVKAAIAYGRGEIGKKELGSANAAAAAAASDNIDSYSFTAASAASASISASSSALSFTHASAYNAFYSAHAYFAVVYSTAASAAADAAASASDIDGAAARKSNLKQTADICREILTGEIKRILGV